MILIPEFERIKKEYKQEWWEKRAAGLCKGMLKRYHQFTYFPPMASKELANFIFENDRHQKSFLLDAIKRYFQQTLKQE